MGFAWKWRDATHIDAHRRDFAVPIEEILDTLEPLVMAEQRDVFRLGPWGPKDPQSWLHRDFELDIVTGVTGLRSLTGGERESFWAYRVGRTIPSHLVVGDKEETRWVCIWGYCDKDAFCIHTIYPGRAAPREIHDPEITLDDLPESIAFWSAHAIVVAEGEYTVEIDA